MAGGELSSASCRRQVLIGEFWGRKVFHSLHNVPAETVVYVDLSSKEIIR